MMKKDAFVCAWAGLAVLIALAGAAWQLPTAQAQWATPPPPDASVPALLAIRQELGNPSPYLDSWLVGGPCDFGGGMHGPPYWQGCTCYDGLWGVNLSSYPIRMPLPASIASIPTLYTVNFTQAQMVGPLPAGWAALPHLMYLDLSGNALTGTIPSAWGGMTYLRGINLASNQLTGTIPQSFTALTNLEYLNVMGNPGVAGPQPMYFSYGSLVAYLASRGPVVSTTAPSALHPSPFPPPPSPPPSLDYTDPSVSTTTGGGLTPPPPDASVPALLAIRRELGSPSPYLDSWLRGGPCDNGGGMDGVPPYWTGCTCYKEGLWGVNLSYYPVAKTLPPSIGRIPTLYTVSFSQAGMVGALPASWAALPHLMYLDLSGNTLTGTIPSAWGGMTYLRGINLASNQLTGTIPQSFTALTNLEYLNVMGNPGVAGPQPMYFTYSSLVAYLGGR